MSLDDLNPEQREAALAPNGVSMIKAGAGTGKSTTLIERAIHLQQNNPGKMLFMAFNTKIVAELKEKMAKKMSEAMFRRMDIRTSHSLAFELIRTHHKQLGLSAPPKTYEKYWDLLDEFTQYLVHELGYSPYEAPTQFQLKLIHGVDTKSLAQGKPLTAEFTKQHLPRKAFGKRRRGRSDDQDLIEAEELVQWAQQFRAWRQTSGKLLFADQLPMALMLDQQAYTDLDFKHVMVDEAQDLSRYQHEMVQRLGRTATTITVVGDSAQSIYRFAGASVEVFNSIPELFPDCHIHKLETNYRCSNEIIALANLTLKHDLGYDLQLKPSQDRPGGAVELYGEAEAIVDWLRSAIQSTNGDWSKIAVLYRAHSHIAELETILQREQIPYFTGKNGFFDSEPVKDILAWLKFASGTASEADWKVVYKTMRYLGEKVGTEVWNKTQGEPHMWPEMFHGIPETIGSGKKKTELWHKLWGQYHLIGNFLMAGNLKMAAFSAQELMEKTWTERLVASTERLKETLATAQAFLDFIEKHQFTNLADVVKFVEARKEDQPEGVQLLTVHKSKGLEWPYVAVWNVGPGTFPIVCEDDRPQGHGKTPPTSEETAEFEAQLREEVHLLYVAATRAMWRLGIFLAADTAYHRDVPLVRHIPDTGTELLDLLNAVR